MNTSAEELLYLADQQAYARSRYNEEDAGLIRESLVIEHALRAAARPDREGWRPIETAPRDGSEVLLGSVGSGNIDFYRWNESIANSPMQSTMPREQYGWCDRCTDPPSEVPTHWMRVDPPQDSDVEQQLKGSDK